MRRDPRPEMKEGLLTLFPRPQVRIIVDPRLSGDSFKLLCYLMARSFRTNQCCLKNKTILRHFGWSRSTFYNHLRPLQGVVAEGEAEKMPIRPGKKKAGTKPKVIEYTDELEIEEPEIGKRYINRDLAYIEVEEKHGDGANVYRILPKAQNTRNAISVADDDYLPV